MTSKINYTLTLVFTILLLLVVQANGKNLSRIKIRDQYFVDDQNRVVLFRGTNAVMKKFPWIPNDPGNDMTNLTQVTNLRNWGFNVVRLGLMWSGLMPERDVINQTYLNEMVNIVGIFKKNFGSI
jgi:endoglycosylceramidase